MTRTEFVLRFPEFESADGAVVESALAYADRAVSDTWGANRDDFLGLVAARYLALMPFGRDARLSTKEGTTTYDGEIDRMKNAHAVARFRLA
ncbi:MAG TPA: hypothetical protein VN903_11010 [Polyangia bacterium]|nr:hypothetical protein [Polyangia bacterium]